MNITKMAASKRG